MGLGINHVIMDNHMISLITSSTTDPRTVSKALLKSNMIPSVGTVLKAILKSNMIPSARRFFDTVLGSVVELVIKLII
jgi:desulfoferrodoxin (superoxide reductase-like protein)